MKRSIVAVAAAALTVGAVGTAGADAAEPANTGCYGETISAIAGGPGSSAGFGHATSDFARFFGRPGLGDGGQLLQAGEIPDGVVVNTCND